MTSKEPRGQVIVAMMKQDKPQNIYRIAKTAGLEVKHADYWVHKLIDSGEALCIEEGGARLYFLQPIFYDVMFARAFDPIFDKMHRLIKSKLEVVQSDDKEAAVFNIMMDILTAIRLKRNIP